MGTSVRVVRRLSQSGNRARKALVGVTVDFTLVLAALAGCSGSATLGEGTPTLNLTSSSFQAGVVEHHARGVLLRTRRHKQ